MDNLTVLRYICSIEKRGEKMKPYQIERKMAMIEQATLLFIEQGFENTTMNQIAENANVGIATLFRYFPNKECLIIEVVKHVIELRNPVYESICYAPINGYEKIERLLDMYLQYIHGESMHYIKLLEAFEVYVTFNAIDEKLVKEIEKSYAAYNHYVRKMLKEGQEDGSINNNVELETLETMLNMFGTAIKKYSLYEVLPEKIVVLPTQAQLIMMKNATLQFIKK